MNRDFWASIVISGFLSLVLGIVGALLTPAIASWYKGWGKTREAAREESERKRYAETMYYLRYPEKFTQFLIRKAITLFIAMGWWLLGSFLTLITALSRIMMQLKNVPLSHMELLGIKATMLGGVFLTAMAYWTAFTAFRKTDRMWHVVNRMDRFLLTVPENVRDRALEGEVLRTNTPIDEIFE